MLAVLLSLAIPLVAFAWFARSQVIDKKAEEFVRFHLLNTVAERADQLQGFLRDKRQSVALLARVPTVGWFAADENVMGVEGVPETGDREVFREWQGRVFNNQVELGSGFSRILAVDRNGEVVGWNTREGKRWLSDEELLEIESLYFGDDEWFVQCMAEGQSSLDVHISQFQVGHTGRPRYQIGFASRIPDPDGGAAPGVVVAFLDWRHIQSRVDRYGVRRLIGPMRGEAEDIYRSSYAWIWGDDADTILAHERRDLYGQKVSELQGGNLLPLVEAAQTSDVGMYPAYEFRGSRKQGAFTRLDGENGFRWVIGVGVVEDDIYAAARQVNHWLLIAALVALLIAGAFAWWVARSMTRPVLAIQEQAERVAAGDLDARVPVKGQDEIAALSRAFNAMTHDLAENRARLIQAEKEAAWREMALQVAHEIKNPLTPIQLSAGLLRRAWTERREEFEPLLHSTLDMIDRQVDNMREVTRDFSDFAGVQKKPERVRAARLLEEVLDLTQAWAQDQGITVHAAGLELPHEIYVHPGEMHRALVNLVNNAIEAMPEGGELHATLGVDGETLTYRIRDTGQGISPEAKAHLFEPHFTTRGSGTGLGLAIVKRVVEGRGGGVTLGPAHPGPGAEAVITLPYLQQGLQQGFDQGEASSAEEG